MLFFLNILFSVLGIRFNLDKLLGKKHIICCFIHTITRVNTKSYYDCSEIIPVSYLLVLKLDQNIKSKLRNLVALITVGIKQFCEHKYVWKCLNVSLHSTYSWIFMLNDPKRRKFKAFFFFFFTIWSTGVLMCSFFKGCKIQKLACRCYCPWVHIIKPSSNYV